MKTTIDYHAIPNNAHAMSKRLCGLDKYFCSKVTKRRLVEDREGSNDGSTANSISSCELPTEDDELSLIETSSSDSTMNSTIEEQLQELDNETAIAISDKVSYS